MRGVGRRPSVLPYVPDVLRAWRPTHGDDRHMQVQGSLAFLDISGFTTLTERLARQGNVGAEQMSDLLDGTFSALLPHGRAEGGDLVKWGGDAVLLLFSGEGHAARACRAAYDMRATLRAVGNLSTPSGNVRLRMSVGVHSGDFDLYLVGDPRHHRELLVVGPEVSTTARMERVAAAGQIVVSERTAALLPAGAHGPGPEEGTRLLRRRPGARRPLQVGRVAAEEDEPRLAEHLPAVIREQVLAEPGEGEHRSIAVAFVRFGGTDELTRRAGVGAVADALEQCIRTVQDAAAEHGVTFFETDIDSDGGKILLVAGAPRSTGRDEERMLRATRAVMDRRGVLDLRIGVNRGNVFAGDFGPAFRRTYSVKGDAVNLAARVMSRARTGEVLATAATLERSPTRFEATPLDPFHVKGKSAPVVAVRVGAVLGSGGARSETPFVGRDAELAVLGRVLDGATEGRGAQVQVVGAAGIGKSRLVAQALSERDDLRVLSAACGEYDRSTPFFPFRALLRGALGLPPDAGQDETTQCLQAVVAAHAPDVIDWLPLLAGPLDLPPSATRATAELDEQYRKTRLEEVVEALLGAVLRTPTVLVVEDVHLVDDASADLLARLGERVASRPWAVVVTRRDTSTGYVPQPGPALVTVVPGPLAASESLQLVRASADVPLTHEAAAALVARSGGNPVFLTELVQAAGRRAAVSALPDSLQALMASEIDRLPPRERTVLRYAAVLGTVTDPGLLEQLLADHVGDVHLADHLAALADFLETDDAGALRFRHSLVRDVAYEGLPYRRRRLLHEQVGSTLERSAEDPERVSELLSLHYFHAGSFDRAWTFSRIAGRRARDAHANAAAIDLLSRAVESARRASEVDPREVAEVLEALGDVCDVAGRSSEAVEAYQQSRRRLDDPVAVPVVVAKEARVLQRQGRLAQALRSLTRTLRTLEGVQGPAAAAGRSELAARYAWVRLRQGRPRDAVRWASSAAREAETAADKVALAHAYAALHAAHHYAGTSEDVPYGRLALLAFEELGDLAGQGHCANNLGVAAIDGGRLSEALEFFALAEQTFARLGDEPNQANASYNSADVLLRQGRFAEARSLLADALVIARAVQDEELVALVLRETGQACLGLGQLVEARRHLADARARLLALGLRHELATVDAAESECLRREQAAGPR